MGEEGGGGSGLKKSTVGPPGHACSIFMMRSERLTRGASFLNTEPR